MNALAANPVNALVQGLYGKAKEAGDYIAQRYQAIKADPVGDIKKTLQGTIDRGATRDALHAKAFGNPKNPLEITDPEAFNELMDQAQSDVTSFAPAGMLRLGGRQDLIATHGTSAGGLLNEDGKLLPELTNMSAAIEKGRVGNSWGNGVKLVLRPNAFDPATSPSIIHTQDAFTPPEWMSELSMLREEVAKPTLNQLLAARQSDRYVRQYPKGGSQVDIANSNVLGNRRFNSYAGYEKSPQGAALLGQGPAVYAPDVQKFVQAMEAHGYEGQDGLSTLMREPGRTFAGFDKYEMFKKLRRTPQDYAELKNFGQAPINSDSFSGAILVQPMPGRHQIAQQAQMYELAQELAKRGIRSRQSTGAAGTDFQLAAELQRRAAR